MQDALQPIAGAAAGSGESTPPGRRGAELAGAGGRDPDLRNAHSLVGAANDQVAFAVVDGDRATSLIGWGIRCTLPFEGGARILSKSSAPLVGRDSPVRIGTVPSAPRDDHIPIARVCSQRLSRFLR
jgi:hypothetical protein